MARRKLENVPDSGLDDYVDYHWDDVEAEAAKAGVGAEDLLFDDLVRRNRLDRFGPECGCRTKVEAEVWLRLSSDAEETWRELYRLAQWGACEAWFDSDGVLRVYGADDLGGRELAALWIAPERGYEEAAGLHVTVDGGPVPVSVYAGMEPEAAAKAIWERIEAIRRKEPGR